MTTFAFEVYNHQKRRDGTYNIKIRITHNRKKKYISTPFYCDKTDLTKSLKIKNQFYIDECQKIIRDFRKKLDTYGMAVKAFPIERIYDILTKEDTSEIDLQSFYDGIKHTIKNRQTIQCSINNFIEYTGRSRVDVREITARLLNGWIDDLLKTKKRQTVISYVSNLRNVFNRAKQAYNDEDIGNITIPGSPFSYIQKIQVFETEKRAISADAITKIAQLEYHPSRIDRFSSFNLAKDMFLLSFALIGMNLADFYDVKKECYKDGRLTYNRVKTRDRRKDKAEISLLVCDDIKPLFEKYLNKGKTPELFVFRSHYTMKSSFETIVNNGLKEIGQLVGIPNLQHYSARHSWATIAYNDCGVDKYVVHQALNHVDKTTAITDVYIKKDWSVIDRANRKVLDFVDIRMAGG